MELNGIEWNLIFLLSIFYFLGGGGPRTAVPLSRFPMTWVHFSISFIFGGPYHFLAFPGPGYIFIFIFSFLGDQRLRLHD